MSGAFDQAVVANYLGTPVRISSSQCLLCTGVVRLPAPDLILCQDHYDKLVANIKDENSKLEPDEGIQIEGTIFA